MTVVYDESDLSFWSEQQIKHRTLCIKTLKTNIQKTLLELNPSWKLHLIDSTVIIKKKTISSTFDDKETITFGSKATLDDFSFVLRPEFTISSYIFAMSLIAYDKGAEGKTPICVWQHGKVFIPDESSANAQTYEKYQLSFVCIYEKSTKGDFINPIESSIVESIKELINNPSVESSSLSDKVSKMKSIKTPYLSGMTEIGLLRVRNDFPNPAYEVIEVTVDLDKLAMAYELNSAQKEKEYINEYGFTLI